MKFGGNVGIGGTNPLSKLHIFGIDTTTSSLADVWGSYIFRVTPRPNSSDATLMITNVGSTTVLGISAASSATTALPLILNPYGGNVGIASTNITYAALNIKASGAQTYNGITIFSTDGTETFFGMGNSGSVCGFNATYGASGSYIPITFTAGGSERMRIRTDGAVSLGTGYAAANSFTYYPNYSNFQPGFTLYSTAAVDLLSFNGNTKQLFLGNLTGGATTLSTDANGNIIRTPSDINLKTNIEDLQYGLETIMQLRPIIHNWKEFIDIEEEKSINMGEGKSIGFIAQEVELLVPEIVCGEEYKSIDYPKMVAILTKAIQEQQVQIEELKAKIK
jgi:hypothetical protein